MTIYFSGIGGVALGPLALIALDAGYSVTGSDPVRGLMTDELMARGVTVSESQDGEYLRRVHADRPIDWLIYTAALPTDHPELVVARELGIRIAKRDELLAEIIATKQLKLIAIAGTHGKTTTTGMMVWVLKRLGIPVSYSVGTTLSWGPSGHYDPGAQYFVYECDEFDRNFLHFQPQVSVITSVEYDHPDTYKTPQEYFDAFSQFAGQSQQVITWADQTTRISLPEASWVLGTDEVMPISLAGEHNRRNATLVAKACEYLGLPDASAAVASFPGTNRRFERIADNLYSDYGHTPTEIAATLQMARELADSVVLVYQPHQNVRQHEIKSAYTDDIFKDAAEVYWLPTYLSREDPALATLTPAQLTTQLHETKLHIAELNPALMAAITHHQQSGQLVLCMGAGSIDSWLRAQLTGKA